MCFYSNFIKKEKLEIYDFLNYVNIEIKIQIMVTLEIQLNKNLKYSI